MPTATWPVWFSFLLLVLATWRVTHLLVEEDGPGDIVVRLRAWVGDGVAGRALDCFLCLSLWVAAAAALLIARDVLPWLVAWLAISAGACLLERASSTQPAITRTISGDGRYVVLRAEASGGAHDGTNVGHHGGRNGHATESDSAHVSR